MIAKATHRGRGPLGMIARARELLLARRRAREEAEDSRDVADALERLHDPEDRPIPWEQVKRELRR